jgi:hypothetical protein
MSYSPLTSDDAFDQTAFVVVLSDEEASRLERERGWKFCL